MALNKFTGGLSHRARQAKEQQQRDAVASDLERPNAIANREQQEANRQHSQIELKGRLERAAMFSEGQLVTVDGIPGVGKVRSVDSRIRGDVEVKHKHLLRAVGYNAGLVHALGEKE